MNGSRIAALLALVVAAVVVYKLSHDSTSGHKLFAVMPAAANVTKGNQLSVGGKNVGHVDTVEPIDRGRAAKVEFTVTDDKAWPLPDDSRLSLRFGGTVSFSNRYFLLTRGTSSSDLRDGQVIPPKQVKIPVEIDNLVNGFTGKVRTGVRSAIDNSAVVYDRSASSLNSLLPKAPGTLDNATGVLGDLTKNQQALGMLLQSGAGVTDAVQRANPGLGTLIDGASQTFDAIGQQADNVRLALQRFPDALTQTQTTLAKADVTLVNVSKLTGTLRPGIAELQTTAPLLNDTLRKLQPAIGPGTRTLGKASGLLGISNVFAEGAYAGPRLVQIGTEGTKAVDCIRPYAPELAALGSKWGDFISVVDDHDHVLRAQIENFLPAPYNSVGKTPAEAKRDYPELEYGFPRPPGTLADQPWFQPQCGAGREALDPNKDPEARHLAGVGVPPTRSAPR